MTPKEKEQDTPYGFLHSGFPFEGHSQDTLRVIPVSVSDPFLGVLKEDTPTYRSQKTPIAGA